MKQRVLILCALLLAAIGAACAQESVRPERMPSREMISVGNERPTSPSLSTVAGSLQTVDGKAVSEAHIELRDMSGVVRGSTYTQSNGTFEFSNVPHGLFDVVATDGIREAHQQINVDASLSQVNLRLPPAGDGSGNTPSITISEMQEPEKARKAIEKAEEAFHKHKLEEARKETEKALQIAPHYAHALTLKGVLDLNDNNLDQAQQELETAIQSDGRYGMAYVVLGAVYNVRSRFDDALRALRQGISMVPNSWQAYFESAKALLGKRQYADALHDVDRATQFVPNKYPPLHLVRAHALLGMNDYSQAANELELFLGSEPNGLDSANARQMLEQIRAYIASNQHK